MPGVTFFCGGGNHPLGRTRVNKKKKKKRLLAFALFKTFSWESDLWVTLGDIKVKKRRIGNRNQYFTENHLSRHEMLCTADNHNYMRHYGFYPRTLHISLCDIHPTDCINITAPICYLFYAVRIFFFFSDWSNLRKNTKTKLGNPDRDEKLY